MRVLIAALAALMLAACSPEYDWREIRTPDSGYAVMLPGKPASMTRTIRLDAIESLMSMQGAKVGETSFTVAVAELPDDSPATRESALAAMRAGMLRNIGGTESGARAVQVSRVDGTGAALGRVPATRVDAGGALQGSPVAMSAGFVAVGNRAWQWVVMGPAVDREQADIFLDSFRLIQVPR